MATVCVFCSGKRDAPQPYLDDAAELGAEVARAGLRLVFGGGGAGMMGALANAAAQHGGEVVGVVPQALIARERSLYSAGELVTTKDLAERKRRMFACSDAVIVMPGGLGTLDELFEIWTQAVQLGVYDVPVILLNTNHFYDGLIEWLRSRADDGLMHHDLLNGVQVVETVADALAIVEVSHRDSLT